MRWRHVLVCLGLLGLLAGPTVALAQGGGSAGDQQYTDPFGSTTHGSSTHTQTQTQTQQTTTSAPATTPPATSTSPATAPATVTGGADTTTTTPVATAASSSGKTLPYTGLDLWTVVGVGLTLMASGILIRVRSRRA
jgi:hypothetical protein